VEGIQGPSASELHRFSGFRLLPYRLPLLGPVRDGLAPALAFPCPYSRFKIHCWEPGFPPRNDNEREMASQGRSPTQERAMSGPATAAPAIDIPDIGSLMGNSFVLEMLKDPSLLAGNVNPPPSSETNDVGVVKDDGDLVGTVDRTLRGDVVNADGLDGMVNGVMAAKGDEPIDSLDFYGHGKPGEQRVATGGLGQRGSLRVDDVCGKENTTEQCDPEVTETLAKLRDAFDEDAEAVLHGCDVAQGEDGVRLLRQLAEVWGIPVTASETSQPALLGGIMGTTTTCAPGEDGDISCEKSEGWMDPLWDAKADSADP